MTAVKTSDEAKNSYENPFVGMNSQEIEEEMRRMDEEDLNLNFEILNDEGDQAWRRTKNRRTFEFYKKNGKRETDTGEHKETKRGKRTGGTLRKNTLLCVGRAILWIMLIFFFVRGVIVTFRPDTLTEAQQVISDF